MADHESNVLAGSGSCRILGSDLIGFSCGKASSWFSFYFPGLVMEGEGGVEEVAGVMAGTERGAGVGVEEGGTGAGVGAGEGGTGVGVDQGEGAGIGVAVLPVRGGIVLQGGSKTAEAEAGVKKLIMGITLSQYNP